MKPTLALLSFAFASLLTTSSCSAAENEMAPPVSLTRENIVARMRLVADWQLANPGTVPALDWRNGAFYPGILAAYRVTGDARYLDAVIAVADREQWKFGSRLTHADDDTIALTYVELYNIKKEPKMLATTRERFDALLALPSKDPHARWTWCDALFMGPPGWVALADATGDKKYLDHADASFWKSHELLYNKEHQLFFRDKKYFTAKEPNGQPMFWARGNGWVMGGLARVLERMPKDYPTREKYVALLREMAASLAKLQQPEGSWHPSLLDPASTPYPEMSATGFIAYGIAWGINNGLLDRAQYEPVLKKTWTSMNAHIFASGKLGSVQSVGERPAKVDPNASNVYGAGAFLAFAEQMFILLGAKK